MDFLQTESATPPQPTAQFIGEHMTREDPFYTPSVENTNPFESMASLRNGQKILASEDEADLSFELSMTLPISSYTGVTPHKPSHSLPDTPGLVRSAIAQFNSQIKNSPYAENNDGKVRPWYTGDDDCSSIDSAVDVSSHNRVLRKRSHTTSTHSKQLNLECAMLFCGLDLIQMHKSKSTDWNDIRPSSDLESEFQDDLEGVLRSCSSSESWISVEESAFSPCSTGGDGHTEWWRHVDKTDPANRYFHPTLIEKRRSLRRVESRTQEKLEQLQQKLDMLRLKTDKKSKKSSTERKAASNKESLNNA